MSDQQRDDVFFSVVERPMGIDELVRKLYTAPTQQTKEHFLHVNAHVINGHARAPRPHRARRQGSARPDE